MGRAAASSKLIPSGMGKQSSAGAIMYSDQEPWPVNAKPATRAPTYQYNNNKSVGYQCLKRTRTGKGWLFWATFL